MCVWFLFKIPHISDIHGIHYIPVFLSDLFHWMPVRSIHAVANISLDILKFFFREKNPQVTVLLQKELGSQRSRQHPLNPTSLEALRKLPASLSSAGFLSTVFNYITREARPHFCLLFHSICFPWLDQHGVHNHTVSCSNRLWCP